jgi:hypothetical protein
MLPQAMVALESVYTKGGLCIAAEPRNRAIVASAGTAQLHRECIQVGGMRGNR